METGKSGVQGHPPLHSDLHSDLEASLGHMRSSQGGGAVGECAVLSSRKEAGIQDGPLQLETTYLAFNQMKTNFDPVGKHWGGGRFWVPLSWLYIISIPNQE